MPEAKTQTAQPFNQGPYLSAAFLCETVLSEGNGVKSIIRIIDRFTITASGPNPPLQMPPIKRLFTLFVRLKSGMARGTYPLRVELIKPMAEKATKPFEKPMFLEGEEDRGLDIVIQMGIQLDQEGIYWFKIFFNNQFLTQVPLRVIYMPEVTQTGGQAQLGGPPGPQEPPTPGPS